MNDLSHYEKAIRQVQEALAEFYSAKSFGEIIVTIKDGLVFKVRVSKDSLIN